MSTARHDIPRHGSVPVIGDAVRHHTPHQRAAQHVDGHEQLSLLTTADVPLQFRLDERTRRRGLAQIALIRRQLDEIAARRDTAVAADHRQVAA